MTWFTHQARQWGPRGVSVFALAAALAALVLAAYAFNPVEQAERQVAEPVARSLGITTGRCPGGWKDTSAEAEHAIVRSCSRDGWLVVLQDGRFSHGFQLDTPGARFVFDPRGVPGWPSE